MVEITKILELSTAHLTKEVSLELDILSASDSTAYECLSVYAKGGYGFFVYIIEESYAENKDQLPECLATCVALAIENDCTMICFDGAGPVEPGIPEYDW